MFGGFGWEAFTGLAAALKTGVMRCRGGGEAVLNEGDTRAGDGLGAEGDGFAAAAEGGRACACVVAGARTGVGAGAGVGGRCDCLSALARSAGVTIASCSTE
ncbi:hypothetical protein H6CHR_03274 [Variovorax sp. PBL-H6]|uniref:hypothetical protein n=1 Tax=Variovorax sp. PBL-H6 TaxID=434009 RepID=UPI0013163DC7|nr:hypothetical protein [Variovorax sp. PBL-H6]VTU29831.1 hypothetical protein H6CHR_03274 [Variovorax sp. PBL-H6]